MTRRKYNNRKVRRDGFTFDSIAEFERYLVLKDRLERGEIQRLSIHPKFVLQEGFRDNEGSKWPPIHYIGDFEYYEGQTQVVEDVKGVATTLWRLKEKLFRKRYPYIVYRVIYVGRKRK